MERYSRLSKLYLEYQKKRTLLTIFGVALASGVLFIILTLYFSNFINNRDRVRAESDYEMVFFPETEEQAAGIINEEFVKDAYVGVYYNTYLASEMDNALFINTKNPYRINNFFDKISVKYGVEGQINDALASYYLQGYAGDEVYIIFLLFLFLAVIFAVIGVGIIRNSIQLNTLEQVKDYGILRCVGATKGQLKSIIFMMGFIQEALGIVLGMLIGYPVAVVIGAVSGKKTGIHIVPVLFVLIAFIGDLYFVMKENSNIIKRMSPVEAVRGSFGMKNKKLKKRGRSIFGHIFGVEGEYAYKSLMGNKGRFFKSVATFTLGIAAFIMISVISGALNVFFDKITGQYGEYQLYYYNAVGGFSDISMSKSYMPPVNFLDRIGREPNVEDVKPMYIANLAVADYEKFYEKFDETYINETLGGEYIKQLSEMKQEDGMGRNVYDSRIGLVGYSDEELEKHEKLLVDGTLHVSDDGLVIVQEVRAYSYPDEDSDFSADNVVGKYCRQNNYNVGDTIDIVDFEKFNKMCAAKYNEYIKHTFDDETKKYEKLMEIYCECWNELVEEGAYKTYTIEGIIKYDIDKLDLPNMTAIVPLENYYAITGLREKDSNGIKYRVKGKLSADMEDSMMDMIIPQTYGSVCRESEYVYGTSFMYSLKNSIRYISLFIIFIVVMTSVNIINTSASNIHLRRSELAQLRAIGVSKKKLCYMVMLEGIITSIVANCFGCILGFGGLIPLQGVIAYMFKLELKFPVAAAIIGVVASTSILCGSVYFPIKRMSSGILNDLNAGGD